MVRNVAVGVGLMEFPFDGIAGFLALGRSVRGGRRQFAVADRPHRQPRADPRMHECDGGAGRPHAPHQVRRQRLSLAFRDPVLLAKQCATIDVLSEGRLLPAFGIGSPLGPEWQTMHFDTKTRGRKTDEGLEIIRRLWSRGRGRFRRRAFPSVRRLDFAEAGAARSADVDRRLVRGGDPAHRAVRHRLAGGRGDAGAGRPGRRRDPKAAAAEAGRAIDDDHYGAGIAYRFGRPDEPGLGRLYDAYRRRTGRDPLRLLRDRRRPGGPRPHRRLCRDRRLEIHPAPGGARRRRDAWPDPPAVEEVLPASPFAGRNRRGDRP